MSICTDFSKSILDSHSTVQNSANKTMEKRPAKTSVLDYLEPTLTAFSKLLPISTSLGIND